MEKFVKSALQLLKRIKKEKEKKNFIISDKIEKMW